MQIDFLSLLQFTWQEDLEKKKKKGILNCNFIFLGCGGQEIDLARVWMALKGGAWHGKWHGCQQI